MMLLAVLILASICNDIESASYGNRCRSSSAISFSRQCEGQSLKKCIESYPQQVRSCKVCGIINDEGIGEMVIQGKTVEPPYMYPWMISLRIRTNRVCGGAIISDSYVLTAAHCVMTAASQARAKYYGSIGRIEFRKPHEMNIGFLTSTYDLRRGPSIARIIPHPGFHGTMTHDIALIKLRRKITCGPHRNPICLPSHSLPISRRDVLHITGWGVVSTNPEKQPHKLQEGQVRIVSFSRCGIPGELEKYSYCSVGVNRQRPCFGDSGGIMSHHHRGKFVAAGVASMHTSPQCTAGKPFIYTTVASYRRWIKGITGI